MCHPLASTRTAPPRRTPMHDWHEVHGAHWEPVGHWRRPYAFVRTGESVHDAVMREVKNTREALGLLDASTLGKLIVKGPDAGRFMDMLYTGLMSSLKPGRCRYGLMCSENGFLIDDGVVARINELEKEIRTLGIVYYMSKPVSENILKDILDHISAKKKNALSTSSGADSF